MHKNESMLLPYQYALLPVAVAIGWMAKSKSGVHGNSTRRTGIQRQRTQRRNDRGSVNTRLIIVMSSSVSFLLGSHLTLLFTRNTTSFNTWTPDNANANHMTWQQPRVQHEHSDNGLLYEKRPEGKFPAGGKHIVAHGSPRTASTLLFNMVGVSKFLYLMRNEPLNMSYIEPKYIKEATHMEQYLLQPSNGTKIYKTHIDLENFVKFDVVVFTTAKDKKDAATIKASLEEQGHDVAYVQDMESLKEGGIPRIAHDFAFGYGLSTQDENDMVEYFSKWEILRQCCGQQMSQYWRNDLFPEIYRKVALLPKHHPFCADYDIDEMEKSFMETKLYSWIDAYPNMRPFNKPSLRDGELNGSYCSSYNELVKTQALSFFGQPQINENITMGNWTEEEHSIFLEGIQKHGSSQPFKISKMLKTRTPMQVHLHLQEYILEASSKTPQNETNWTEEEHQNGTNWTEEEHSIFLEALRKHGSDHPRKIAANLRTRTGIPRTGMEVQEHLQEYIRETLSKTPQSEDNEEEVMKRPVLEDKDYGIGGIVLAYDETGKLILLDKSSMSEIKETGKLILLDKKSSTSEIKV